MHALCTDIGMEYRMMLSGGPRLPLGACGCCVRKRYQHFVARSMPTLHLVLEAEDLHERLRSHESLAVSLSAGLEAMGCAPGVKRWFACCGRRRRVGRVLHWASS